MELSDIITAAEQKALDVASARVKKANDAVTLAHIHYAAKESAASEAEVKAAAEELKAAIAIEDALVRSFDSRFVALARKALGPSPR